LVETYSELVHRLRRELKALGTKNVVVHLLSDFLLPSGQSAGKILKVKFPGEPETAIDFGAFYCFLRNATGELYLSTKIGIQKIDRFARDPADYPVLYLGGGHPE
jgi:hypothetical protein